MGECINCGTSLHSTIKKNQLLIHTIDLKGIMLSDKRQFKGYLAYKSIYMAFSNDKNDRTDEWFPG